MSELQKRIATAVVLIPVLVYCVFYLPNTYFKVFMALVMSLGLWEWCRMIGIKDLKGQALYIALGLGLCLVLPLIPSILVYGLASLWWLFAIYLVLKFPASAAVWKGNVRVQAAIGLLLLLPTWLGIVSLQAQGAANLVFVFVLIWAADSGAYFAGRQFGKNKLAPDVSPGKSIEGVLGGLLLVLVIGLIFKSQVGLGHLGFVGATVLFSLVVLFSVLGDLCESMFKRIAGVKDSSQLLPGHGGVLDRIDSLTSAIPIYFAVLALLS